MSKKAKKPCIIENNAQKYSGSLLKDDVKCPVCLCILVEPVTMPCKHSACRLCFLDILKQTTLQCPVCRCRVGNFARLSMKSGTLVNDELWTTIQKDFKDELLLQHGNGSTKDNSEDISLDPAEPGEIKEEFEKQIVLLHEACKDKSRLEQEEKDKRIAAALHEALNSPALLTRLQASSDASGGGKRKSVLLLSSEGCPTRREKFFTPPNKLAAPCSVEKSSSEEDSCSDEEAKSSVNSSSRRLFQNLSLISENVGKKQGRQTRKRKKSPGKENGAAPRTKTYSAPTKEFPGCRKRPKVSGTADLSVSYVDSSDDVVILDESNKNSNIRSIKKIQVTSSGGSSCSEVQAETNVIPDDILPSLHSSSEKNEASEEIHICNHQNAKGTGGHARKRNSSSRSKKKKSSATVNTSSVLTNNLAAAGGASTSAEREHVQLQDDAYVLLLDGSADTGGDTAVVAEQRMLETRLRQEAEDAKLARRLQRHLATVTVDRTQGSGEEYQLRPRRRRCSPAPAPAPEARTERDASPCY